MSTEQTGLTARFEGLDWRRVWLYAVLLGFAGFYLAPLESGLTTAFKTQSAFFETTPFVPAFGDGFTVSAWMDAWATLQGPMVNSMLFAIPATVLSAVLGSLAAYGLTHVDWRGQVVVLLLFVAGVFIPYQSVLVPLSRFWTIVNLQSLLAGVPFLAERVGLIELTVTHTAYGIPICTVLFRGYYQTLNTEMLEAARLDGASLWRVYRKIVLPLSKPMFAVTLIYQFTNIWNDLLFALVLVTSPSNQVVTLALNELQGSMVTQYNLQMAGAFLAALPTLVVYVLFGDQFARGVAGET
ncbi:carbohydrate ABC transporter permease [Haladaptatus sp. GCM10025707]|uniref:carbohydrate ABC transporter permease n=1 Tax=unclassified Haladaptatus TaxID=2622732 RepID=UPI0023E8C157|nr:MULTISPECIES: carbohydrate ABC transporter permease [unclassified Haladaptatus]